MQRWTRAGSLAIIALIIVVTLPSWSVASQSSSGPAAYYAPSWDPVRIFNTHLGWGNVVGSGRPPHAWYCVHPDYRPGQMLRITANGRTVDCLIFDSVRVEHQAQWRSRWALEVDYGTFVGLGLNQNNHVIVHGLASVSSPVPATPVAPRSRYFSETGESIGHGFLAYWERNGGLPIFGYPLTGERSEDGRTVQYFERAVFEWHPEKPLEYQVLLRRLGAEAWNDGES